MGCCSSKNEKRKNEKDMSLVALEVLARQTPPNSKIDDARFGIDMKIIGGCIRSLNSRAFDVLTKDKNHSKNFKALLHHAFDNVTHPGEATEGVRYCLESLCLVQDQEGIAWLRSVGLEDKCIAFDHVNAGEQK
jgi:hypothetical protein